MGDRANIEFQEEDGGKMYFYSHWGGLHHMKGALRRALAKHERWDDESYLARIIFGEVIKDNIEGTTGFGLSTVICEAESPRIVVNVRSQTVTIGKKDYSFEQFAPA